MSSIKLKTFATHVIKTTISREEVDPEKYLGYFQSHDDLKASYNCILFLITSAVKFGVGRDIFTVELQQLGLSKEHSVALGKVLDEFTKNLTEYLQKCEFSIRKPTLIAIETVPGSYNDKMLQMKVSYFENCEEKIKKINVKFEQNQELLKELKRIQFIMKEYSS